MDNEDLKKLLAHIDTIAWILSYVSEVDNSPTKADALQKVRIDLKRIGSELSKEEPK